MINGWKTAKAGPDGRRNPKSRMVCGEKAWNQLGRKRKEDAVCVQLILPEIRAGERESYRIDKEKENSRE